MNRALLPFLGALLAVGSVAHAQEAPFPTDEFSALTYRPTPSSHGYLMVEGVEVGGFQTPELGLQLDFALQPLEIQSQCRARPELNCEVVGEEVAIVESLWIVHATVAIALGDRLELGLGAPLLYASGDGMGFRVDDTVNSDVRGGSSAGIGDVRGQVKAHLLGGEAHGWGLSVVGWATAPTGQATAERRYVGDDGPTFGALAAFEMWMDRFRVAANLGGGYRPARGVVGTEVNSGMTYAAAISYHATGIASALAEVVGTTSFRGFDEQLEGRLGGTLSVGDVTFSLAGGMGLILGPGVPDFRLIAGMRYAGTPVADQDGDGVSDDIDACPDQAEDADGFADEDGCPEDDNDGDGLGDADDPCPDDAEDIDEHEDEDGCPDDDNDGDGVRDGYDSCPDTPEDMDGDRDTDGCPDSDTDRDGIDDSRDQCPEEPEDTDGLADDDGCPDVDADGDGIRDERDECPEDPEDRDRFQDRDGCPEEGGRIRARPREQPGGDEPAETVDSSAEDDR